jgi:hypothetical protein
MVSGASSMAFDADLVFFFKLVDQSASMRLNASRASVSPSCAILAACARQATELAQRRADVRNVSHSTRTIQSPRRPVERPGVAPHALPREAAEHGCCPRTPVRWTAATAMLCKLELPVAVAHAARRDTWHNARMSRWRAKPSRPMTPGEHLRQTVNRYSL